MTDDPEGRPAGSLASAPAAAGKAGMAGFALVAIALSACLVAAIGASVWMWGQAEDGPPMTLHGWIALGLGVSLTLGLGVGLMALTFHSSRSGHDETAADSGYLRDS